MLSRCQQFEFRRITNKDISGRMEKILAADGYEAEGAALSLIAELGDGSMRDSLSVLDKCVGASDGKLAYDDVVKIVGIADNDALYSLSVCIASGDTKAALEKIDEVIEKGKELGLFAERLMKYLRDVLVVKITGNAEEFLNTSAENRNKIEELTEQFSKERLIRAIDLLCAASAQARYSGFPRTLYEMALVKMCEPEMEETEEALLDRISVLEQKVKEGVIPISAAPADGGPRQAADAPPWDTQEDLKVNQRADTALPVKKEKAKPAEEHTDQPAAPAAGGTDAASRWPEIMNYVKSHGGMPIFPHLALVQAKMVNGKLCVVFGDNALVSKSVISKPANVKLIEEAAKSVTGEDIPVACVTSREIGIEGDDPLKKLEELSKTHSEIEFI